MECPSCKKRFQFPVKPGKTLSVKCPRCGASYRVSFVNPVVELLKGRLKWSALSQSEKNKLLVVGLVIIICLGLVLSSASKPIKPIIQETNNAHVI